MKYVGAFVHQAKLNMVWTKPLREAVQTHYKNICISILEYIPHKKNQNKCWMTKPGLSTFYIIGKFMLFFWARIYVSYQRKTLFGYTCSFIIFPLGNKKKIKLFEKWQWRKRFYHNDLISIQNITSNEKIRNKMFLKRKILSLLTWRIKPYKTA